VILNQMIVIQSSKHRGENIYAHQTTRKKDLPITARWAKAGVPGQMTVSLSHAASAIFRR